MKDLQERLDWVIPSCCEPYARLRDNDWVVESDCVLYRTGISFPLYSGVSLARFSAENANTRIEEVRGQLAAHTWSWVITPTAQPADLAMRLERAGAAKLVDLKAMATPLEDLAPAPELPAGVTLVPAQDEESVRAYARLYPMLFDAPLDGFIDDLVEAEVEIFRSGFDPFHRYLAVEGGKPIAAGMTMKRGRDAILQTLLTLPECRNRGIGQALCTHALLAEKECDTALVWSGPGADKLYSRMGFREVFTGSLYAFL